MEARQGGFLGKREEVKVKGRHTHMIHSQVGEVSFKREDIKAHADQLVEKLRGNLTNSMSVLGVDILEGTASFVDNHTVEYGKPGRVDIGGE